MADATAIAAVAHIPFDQRALFDTSAEDTRRAVTHSKQVAVCCIDLNWPPPFLRASATLQPAPMHPEHARPIEENAASSPASRGSAVSL